MMALNPKYISLCNTGHVNSKDRIKTSYLLQVSVCPLHSCTVARTISRSKFSNQASCCWKTFTNMSSERLYWRTFSEEKDIFVLCTFLSSSTNYLLQLNWRTHDNLQTLKDRILSRMQESFSVDTCMVLPISAAVRSGASRKQQDRLLLGAHKNESYVSNLSHVPRREIASTVFATADSDQTLPNQNGGGGQSGPITPNPELDPTQVVQAQLRALRAKDFATVFEFASPDNKQRTGPLAHFCQILEGRAYNVMIGHTTAEVLSSISVSTSRFQQRILIKGSEGNKAIFSWSLSQQEEGPLKGCWMTDAVRRDD
ncbi:hypothetical protein O6H91_03G114200 [Diphasiastrum complanatum]|uniref:Uncharacterized protein n=5 Tax=Diphasiastrum complanatum TaxID=34168 RepID=A0ACC2EAQ0_DIPCM|nr:hypothetical protein O6H91_03G114200 [Diphasiastrum complanatum]KAJ7563532.1 hypothetical protein O6H91_03G114200 [Diphasiastrum complanatum]KAJ7563533.1 hypothetical protein O6H91_03G114200 [Diphasiastrum complanatum]KAJ7563535.1 hypothetical protein O6H91_03G114200 [Diphasiastrum complanatum]KAJ7563536.1 hypothetical protein O6H91_03G114200 [Diphasiastrum complanatum]